MKRTLKRLLTISGALLLITLSALFYAHFIEPRRLVLNEETLHIGNWSKNLNNFKVVAISDIHGGSYTIDEERIKKIVELANAQNPDLIVLLGDYVSQVRGTESDLKMPSEIVAENLQGLHAKYGVYAVIGNHDWWFNEKKITAELENAKIKVLNNEISQIIVGTETVNIWGIEDYWKRSSVQTTPFDNLPNQQNTIAVTHNPDSLFKTPKGISIMFAGHSHGGQVNFPIYGRYPFVNDIRLMAGLSEIDDKKVFVTTGIGTSGPSIRFRVPPEIAVLTLVSTD